VFDEFRYRASAGGGARKQGGPAAQPARVSEPRVFILGGNASTLAGTSSFRAATESGKAAGIVTARLVPLAWTPRGVCVGDGRQDVGIPADGILEWIDRTFPGEDEHAFVASLRDIEMLTRIGWETPIPEVLDQRAVLNIEDIPDEIVEGLARPHGDLVACAVCRSLCVRDEFVWKDRQLCAWDYHAQVFGKRGPWHEGLYEERHFESVPSCAYVAPPLLEELGVQEVLAIGSVAQSHALSIVNATISGESSRTYMAVKTESGFSVLREV
jgi:hypothetical protein